MNLWWYFKCGDSTAGTASSRDKTACNRKPALNARNESRQDAAPAAGGGAICKYYTTEL